MPVELLIAPIARALVPGTEMSLRRRRADLDEGRAIVVVLRSGEGPAGEPERTVGTVARVIGVTPLENDAAMVRLRGEHLVRIPSGALLCGETQAPVTPVDETSGNAAPLDARAEAGLGGDVYPWLSNDPVTASHEVASLLQISWPEIQDILEAGNAASRLRKGLAIMERETELLRRLMSWEGS